jgi:hypothetical protein
MCVYPCDASTKCQRTPSSVEMSDRRVDSLQQAACSAPDSSASPNTFQIYLRYRRMNGPNLGYPSISRRPRSAMAPTEAKAISR